MCCVRIFVHSANIQYTYFFRSLFHSFDVCSMCCCAWLKLKSRGCIFILCMCSWFHIRYGSTFVFFCARAFVPSLFVLCRARVRSKHCISNLKILQWLIVMKEEKNPMRQYHIYLFHMGRIPSSSHIFIQPKLIWWTRKNIYVRYTHHDSEKSKIKKPFKTRTTQKEFKQKIERVFFFLFSSLRE